ncbi:MAG: hypothetical protein ACR2JD_05855 [Nocardioides sp.]
MIDHGLVIADATAASLKSSLGDLVTMTFAHADHAVVGAERAVRRSREAAVSRDGSVVRVRVAHGSELAAAMVVDLAGAGVSVRRLEVVGPTLDDVFLDLTGRSLREAHDAAEVSTSSTTPNESLEGAAALTLSPTPPTSSPASCDR